MRTQRGKDFAKNTQWDVRHRVPDSRPVLPKLPAVDSQTPQEPSAGTSFFFLLFLGVNCLAYDEAIMAQQDRIQQEVRC